MSSKVESSKVDFEMKEAAQKLDHNGDEYDPANWDAWEEAHPEENWIAYSDSDGNTHRVPVWYYFTLGL